MLEKDHNVIITRETQAIKALNSSTTRLIDDAMSKNKLHHIIANGLFTPKQDEEISYWFARFITVRSNLWTIVDTSIIETGGMKKLANATDWQYFVLGYSAVCSLVRLDRFLLNNVAFDSVIQRKLNEPFPQHRIERKQYSHIFSQLVLPSNAIRIHQAHGLLRKHRNIITQAVAGSVTESVFRALPKQESFINLSKHRYCVAWLRSRQHAWRRLGASAKQKSLFTMLEYAGRAVSEISLPRTKKVTPTIITELEDLLKPGDIFVTRHKRALTNLFLPGFWPHAALYVGSEEQRKSMSINVDSKHFKYWVGKNRTLEALKDGVHFRRLEDTLSVDAFVVIRPNLKSQEIAQAIARVVVHAGKDYNFDFDFFRSDQLVCTEVIYRAYDGINGLHIPLQERMGRKTFSAEDLLDLAVDTNWGEAIAIFGVGTNKKELITGSNIKKTLINSYRQLAQD